MAKKVQIQKTVFDKTAFKETIDRNFSFFRLPDPIVDPDTIGDLFRLYDKLYLEIPIDGDSQSHEYLVKKSSELYKVTRQLESIQPLLDEVAQLRTEILNANRRIIELETQLAGGEELDFTDVERVAGLQADLAAANANIAALEQANTVANAATEAAQEAATAAQEAAAKAAEDAAEQAAEQAANQAANQQMAQEVEEIKKIIKNWKKDNIGLAYRFISRGYFASYFFKLFQNYSYANRISRARGFRNKFYWLYGKDASDDNYPSKRFGRYEGDYFIPTSRTQAEDMTLDFFVSELTQAGFKASSIVQAVQDTGNMKKKVEFRVITFKDPDKEDEVGYRLK